MEVEKYNSLDSDAFFKKRTFFIERLFKRLKSVDSWTWITWLIGISLLLNVYAYSSREKRQNAEIKALLNEKNTLDNALLKTKLDIEYKRGYKDAILTVLEEIAVTPSESNLQEYTEFRKGYNAGHKDCYDNFISGLGIAAKKLDTVYVVRIDTVLKPR